MKNLKNISGGNKNALLWIIPAISCGKYNYSARVVDMDKRIATIIGMNLQRLRTQYGLTQEQLAEKVGISTSFYANLERGNKGVSISVLYDLANCLGVSVDYLIYPNQADARIRNIETLLRDKPESFIIAVERLVRLCIEEFSKSE